MSNAQILPAAAFCVIVLLSIGLSAGDRPCPNRLRPGFTLDGDEGREAGVSTRAFSPRWAETSDRFWYAFETAQGRKFMLVDPLKRTKAPLLDNAKMAAMLTNITRIPYESSTSPSRRRR